MNRSEKAMSLFKSGYNCAQSVACAYADVLKMEEKDIARMISGFGGGFGRLQEVCGAVSGMVFVINVLQGTEPTESTDVKMGHYGRVQKICKAYETENGSIVCRTLLGLDRKADSSAVVKKRPCVELVGCAAEILEKHLTEEGLL